MDRNGIWWFIWIILVLSQWNQWILFFFPGAGNNSYLKKMGQPFLQQKNTFLQKTTINIPTIQQK